MHEGPELSDNSAADMKGYDKGYYDTIVIKADCFIRVATSGLYPGPPCFVQRGCYNRARGTLRS